MSWLSGNRRKTSHFITSRASFGGVPCAEVRHTATTHEVWRACLQLRRSSRVELTSCRHPVYNWDTDIQNKTAQILSFSPSVWYSIVLFNPTLFGACVLLVIGSPYIYSMMMINIAIRILPESFVWAVSDLRAMKCNRLTVTDTRGRNTRYSALQTARSYMQSALVSAYKKNSIINSAYTAEWNTKSGAESKALTPSLFLYFISSHISLIPSNC